MTIAIIDDHTLILDGLKDIVSQQQDVTIVETFSSAKTFLEEFNKAEVYYDIVITDIDMPDYTGFEMISQIRQDHPKQKILVLSMHKNKTLISNLFNLKINGYMFKDNSSDELIEAIGTILAGNNYMTEEVRQILDREVKNMDNQLTKREIQILQMIS
ncbi:MAG: response regulator transcription factor, partial [Bacteroidetes bacterium]|nr:response regulator transcription factor [Bacteroidota bacterium]